MLTQEGHFLFVLKSCPSKKGSVKHTLATNQWPVFSEVLGWAWGYRLFKWQLEKAPSKGPPPPATHCGPAASAGMKEETRPQPQGKSVKFSSPQGGARHGVSPEGRGAGGVPKGLGERRGSTGGAPPSQLESPRGLSGLGKSPAGRHAPPLPRPAPPRPCLAAPALIR